MLVPTFLLGSTDPPSVLGRGVRSLQREMGKATGAKQPSESQKGKATCAMKAAKDRPTEAGQWREACRGKSREWRWLAVVWVPDFAKDVGRAVLGRRLASLGPVCAQRPLVGAFQGSVGRQQEGAGAGGDFKRRVRQTPLAAEGEARSGGSQSLIWETW